MITYQRPDGQQVQGYLAKPAKQAGAPGIVVIQEWWGLNDQIRGVADRLARAGYVALVPDLYRGSQTVEEEEAHHLMTNLNFGDAATQDIRGAVQYLKQHCERVGVTGYCMGGALTLLALCNTPEADAGVVWYGLPPLEYIDASKIRCRCKATGPRKISSSRSSRPTRSSRSCARPVSMSSSTAISRTTPSPMKRPWARAASPPRSTTRFGRNRRGIVP
jgi:dienelactone hydrolase